MSKSSPSIVSSDLPILARKWLTLYHLSSRVIAKLPRRWPVGKGDAEDAAAFKVAQVDFDSGDDDDVAGRGQASAASRQQQR